MCIIIINKKNKNKIKKVLTKNMCCGIIKVHCDKEALKDKALQSK